MANDWRTVTDVSDYLRGQGKRISAEERRPRVTQASDLLGPGIGPHAITVEDANGDVAAFNAMWVAPPGALNTPDAGKWWIGESIASSDQGGTQIVSTFRIGDEPHIQRMRGWGLAPGGTARVYSPWQLMGGSPTPEVVTETITGISPYSGGSLTFTRQGNVVEMSGGLSRPSGSSVTYSLVAVIPSGYRPPNNRNTPTIVIFAGNTLGQYQLTTDGSLYARQAAANANAIAVSGYAYLTTDPYPS